VRGYQGPAILLAGAVALSACSSSHQDADATVGVAPSESAGNLQVLESAAFGFRIAYPKGWTARRDFRGGYLANDDWKAYAEPGSQGTPVAALVVPDSNHITNAELRIGVSRGQDEVRACAALPSSARHGSMAQVQIDGAAFVRFDAGDAAMSHYLDVHSYRVVHEGACYALDLLVYGVDPRAYDPPATPPFSKAQAFAAMEGVLRSFQFTR
jgi:hypothetical protein